MKCFGYNLCKIRRHGIAYHLVLSHHGAKKLEIVGNYVNIDYLEFCAGAKCEAAVTPSDSSSTHDSTLAIVARYNVNFGASQTYGVYGLDGRLVAKFTAVGTENLRAKTAESVRLSGTYLVKPFRGGRTYRIAVQK